MESWVCFHFSPGKFTRAHYPKFSHPVAISSGFLVFQRLLPNGWLCWNVWKKKNKSFQLLEKEFFPTKLFQFLGIYNPIQCFSLFLFPKLFPESVSHPVWPRLFPCPISSGAWRGKVGFEGDLWILAVFFQGCSGIFDLGGEAGQLCRFLLWLQFPACQSRKC